jgi:hypothetical protein
MNIQAEARLKTAKSASTKYISIDTVIDARCHHSWPYNPYHRVADCLTFILPALQNYAPIRKSKYHNLTASNLKIPLIVDESSEILCDNLSRPSQDESDMCILTQFQTTLRTRYYYQCIKISIFHDSPHWYRTKEHVSVLAKEVIWLAEQKNPFTYGSGFLNVKHTGYASFLKEYRRTFFEGFCGNCLLSNGSKYRDLLSESKNSGFGYDLQQSTVLILRRAHGLGRELLEQEELERAVETALSKIRFRHRSDNTTFSISRNKKEYSNSSSIHNHSEITKIQNHSSPTAHSNYTLAVYSGNESLCETIAMFWSAKVIIAGHGAGIVNTVFSRPNALLIEISPDRLGAKNKGQPWRTNSPFAQSVGLNTHIIVVPHNKSAQSDGDIQKVFPMSITQDHIDKIVKVMIGFLKDARFTLSRHNRTNNTVKMRGITVMV